MEITDVSSGELNSLLTTDALNYFQSGCKWIHELMIILDSGSKEVKQATCNVFHFFSLVEKELAKNTKMLIENCLSEECQLSGKQSKLHSLKKSLTVLTASLEKLEENCERQRIRVQDAEEEVQECECSVSRAVKKLDEARVTQRKTMKAALITSFIPYVNIVAVPVLLTVSLTALQSAIDEAECSLHSAHSSLSDAQDTYRDMQRSQNQKQKELQEKKQQQSSLETEIAQSKHRLDCFKALLSQKNCLLSELKRSMKPISVVAGRAEVLHGETLAMYDISLIHAPLQRLVEKVQAVPARYQELSLTTSDLWKAALSGEQISAVCEADDWC